jgi:nitrogenase-stabilizing/protective protein
MTQTMTQTLAVFNTLSTAEEYLQFFNLPYDPEVVSVNRLHILQKFSQLIQGIEPDLSLSESDRLAQYRVALESAYALFLTSSPLEQKLFKVFQKKPGNVVLLSDIEVE